MSGKNVVKNLQTQQTIVYENEGRGRGRTTFASTPLPPFKVKPPR